MSGEMADNKPDINEIPQQPGRGISRRNFLKLMGIGAAAATVASSGLPQVGAQAATNRLNEGNWGKNPDTPANVEIQPETFTAALINQTSITSDEFTALQKAANNTTNQNFSISFNVSNNPNGLAIADVLPTTVPPTPEAPTIPDRIKTSMEEFIVQKTGKLSGFAENGYKLQCSIVVNDKLIAFGYSAIADDGSGIAGATGTDGQEIIVPIEKGDEYSLYNGDNNFASQWANSNINVKPGLVLLSGTLDQKTQIIHIKYLGESPRLNQATGQLEQHVISTAGLISNKPTATAVPSELQGFIIDATPQPIDITTGAEAKPASGWQAISKEDLAKIDKGGWTSGIEFTAPDGKSFTIVTNKPDLDITLGFDING